MMTLSTKRNDFFNRRISRFDFSLVSSDYYVVKNPCRSLLCSSSHELWKFGRKTRLLNPLREEVIFVGGKYNGGGLVGVGLHYIWTYKELNLWTTNLSTKLISRSTFILQPLDVGCAADVLCNRSLCAFFVPDLPRQFLLPVACEKEAFVAADTYIRYTSSFILEGNQVLFSVEEMVTQRSQWGRQKERVFSLAKLMTSVHIALVSKTTSSILLGMSETA